MRKVALIIGIISKDGYYLTKLLLDKNYEVHGMVQTMSQYNGSFMEEFRENSNFFIHIGDMTDTSSLNGLLDKIKPDEIYHFASQSHVDISFDIPEYTAQVNALGTLRLLEAVKNSEIRTKLFNLSTPYLFDGENYPQNELTQFNPKTPYAISKQYAHNMVISYRENFNIFAVNGICYNHVSNFKNSSFVFAKIINAAKKDDNFVLELGNLDSIREFGNAESYAKAIWLTLQCDKPNDFVISTGKGYSIRNLVEKIYSKVGLKITWNGVKSDEVGIDQFGNKRIIVSSQYVRPSDPHALVGDSTKLKELTGYQLNDDIDLIISKMLEE